MLAWFTDDERETCRACGELSCVTLTQAVASFCLGCGAITIEGRRIDVDRQLPDLSR
jgi:hypothetical protein